jgi:hypothetical protein
VVAGFLWSLYGFLALFLLAIGMSGVTPDDGAGPMIVAGFDAYLYGALGLLLGPLSAIILAGFVYGTTGAAGCLRTARRWILAAIFTPPGIVVLFIAYRWLRGTCPELFPAP